MWDTLGFLRNRCFELLGLCRVCHIYTHLLRLENIRHKYIGLMQKYTAVQRLTFNLLHGASEPLPSAEYPKPDAVDDDSPDSNDGVVERQ